MLKTLVIVTTRFGLDGISNVARNYYLYQNHDRIKMDILTINDIPADLKQIIHDNGDQHFVMSNRNKNPLSYIRQLAKLCKQNQYDLVHVHGCSSTMFVELLAAKLGGVKKRIAHSHSTKCNHMVINRILKPLFNCLLTDAFACGKEAGEWLFYKKDFHIINNGVDLQKFTPNKQLRESLRKELNLTDRLVIAHVGRFTFTKNHHKILGIFSSVKAKKPDTSLLLWGEGELFEEVKAEAAGIEGDIRFMGLSNELYKWLNVVDVIVFPSVFEGLPLFLVEAQAMGLRCVVSDTVSRMTKLTKTLTFYPLQESNDQWADEILQTHGAIDYHTHDDIVKAGFDINSNCNNILKIYNNLI